MMKRALATVLALVLLGACTQEAATSHDDHDHDHDHGPAPCLLYTSPSPRDA